MGTVFSGRGEGEFYVNLYARNIYRALGIRPYPGTLNIRLNEESIRKTRELLRGNPVFIIEPPMEGYGRVYAWPGFIKCTRVYIIRPEKTVYREDVVELIAEDNLRELLGLKDSDVIKVLISLKKDSLPPYCI